MQNFIKTDNAETIKVLKNQGFTFLGEDKSGIAVFLNDGKLTFSEDTKKNMVFTNLISM